MIKITTDDKGDTMKKHIILFLVLLLPLCIASMAFGAIVVGRIAHVEGEIYRYMDGDQAWVETFKETPAGTQDVLATGINSRAAIAFSNNSAVRLDENTEIEILDLDEYGGSFILHAGLARFYNRNSSGKLTVETARGMARIAPGSIIDISADGLSVVVASVLGKADFQSFNNGIEQVEVISGLTSLEFRETGIVAGTGPIDREWNRWCAERENIWSGKHLVRSLHLPETMQGYAHVLESHGSWRRIYYQGYFYWAWKPRHIAAGWAPYTTGYWYNWHGGPVWVDHNPWGWVTHHHGHWIHKHGAWMWTAYVHNANVPGVTVIGFNISFGRKYKPHWHPGRVRWVTHKSYVGWMPLSPWETYYGYRKWGPRSVVELGTSGFSIRINLASQRYINHTVIIPKHHLYKKGKPALENNYKTVRISTNKEGIVKNYKTVTAAAGDRDRKQAGKTTRSLGQTDIRAVNKRQVVTSQNYKRVDDSASRIQNKGQIERTVKNPSKKIMTLEKRKTVIAKYEQREKKNFISRQNTHLKTIETQEETVRKRDITARKNSSSTKVAKTRNKLPDKSPRYSAAQSGKRTPKEMKKKTVVRQDRLESRKKGDQHTPVAQTLPPKNKDPKRRQDKDDSRKKVKDESQDKADQERQVARARQFNSPKRRSSERMGKGKRREKTFAAASLDNRRFR